MNENGQAPGPGPHEIPDPTIDRNMLLARVGEAQMRLEAVMVYVEQLRAENAELRVRLETFDPAPQPKAQPKERTR